VRPAATPPQWHVSRWETTTTTPAVRRARWGGGQRRKRLPQASSHRLGPRRARTAAPPDKRPMAVAWSPLADDACILVGFWSPLSHKRSHRPSLLSLNRTRSRQKTEQARCSRDPVDGSEWSPDRRGLIGQLGNVNIHSAISRTRCISFGASMYLYSRDNI